MIWNRTGGSDDGPLLVLLHGLGGTAELWRGVEALLPGQWPGGWLALDLPGHGRSPRAASYTFDAQAALVAEVLPRPRPGAARALMAGWSRRDGRVYPGVRRVVGFSIETWWPLDQVEGMRVQSLKPARVFATREEAIERYLTAFGLRGLTDPGAPEHEAGVVECDDGWRIAQDMGTFDFGVPDMPALLAEVSCPVTLALVRSTGSSGPTTTETSASRSSRSRVSATTRTSRIRRRWSPSSGPAV